MVYHAPDLRSSSIGAVNCFRTFTERKRVAFVPLPPGLSRLRRSKYPAGSNWYRQTSCSDREIYTVVERKIEDCHKRR